MYKYIRKYSNLMKLTKTSQTWRVCLFFPLKNQANWTEPPSGPVWTGGLVFDTHGLKCQIRCSLLYICIYIHTLYPLTKFYMHSPCEQLKEYTHAHAHTHTLVSKFVCQISHSSLTAGSVVSEEKQHLNITPQHCTCVSMVTSSWGDEIWFTLNTEPHNHHV